MSAGPPRDQQALRALLALDDVPRVARGLIGCQLRAGAMRCTIVETEAYHESEPACHGYLGRTPRAAKLRRPPGHAYVYLSYGIHRLVNIVTGPQHVASGVLVRGVEVDMAGAEPRGVPGPGRVGVLLGAQHDHDGIDLLGGTGPWRLTAAAPGWPEPTLAAGPRIGISKAVELPWRFWVPGSAGVSRPRAAPGG